MKLIGNKKLKMDFFFFFFFFFKLNEMMKYFMKKMK